MMNGSWGVGALAMACLACSPSNHEEATRGDRAPEPAAAEERARADDAPPEEREEASDAARVTFVVGDEDEVVVTTEVAATPAARSRGLMHRESLPEGGGMIFVFPNREDHVFWMKETLIPLDMIFIDGPPDASDLRVVGVVHRAEPKTRTPRHVGAPSRWVVEVPGGVAEARGIREGVRVRFEGVPAVP